MRETHSDASGSSRGRRKEIPATYGLHQDPVGFINLVISERGGTIVLDPHLAGACVISLDKEGVTMLRNILTEGLG